MMTLGSFFSYLFGLKSTSKSPPPSENNSSSSADESSAETSSSSEASALQPKNHDHPFIPASKHLNLPVRRRQREDLLIDMQGRLRNVESEILRSLKEYDKTYNTIGSMMIEQKQEAALEVLEFARELTKFVDRQREIIPWRRKEFPKCPHRQITYLELDEADVQGLVPFQRICRTEIEEKNQNGITLLVNEMIWGKTHVVGLVQKAAEEWAKSRGFDKDERELQANALVECIIDSVQQEYQNDHFLITTEKDVMEALDSLVLLEDRLRTNVTKESALGDAASEENLLALNTAKTNTPTKTTS